MFWKPQTTKTRPKKKANLNSSVSVKEIEFITQNLPEKKPPGPHDFFGKFYQTFQELTQIRHSLFQKTEDKGTLHSFYEASTTLVTGPCKDGPRGQQTLPEEGQGVHTFFFEAHMVSVATSQLCNCTAKKQLQKYVNE